MTAVNSFAEHEDGELVKSVEHPADAHPTAVGDRRRSAAERDLSGRERDRAALARDRAADLLDAKARERDAVSDKLTQAGRRTPVSSGRDVVLRAERDRQRASQDRACAAAERALAAEDRAHAAADRLRAAGDRRAAIADQQLADTRELPGVWAREHGLVALQREVDRARRTGTTITVIVIVVEFEDVDGRPDDAPLHAVVSALLSSLRSYDFIIRTGDANFVAAVCGASIAHARTRSGAVRQALGGEGIAISVGCAELADRDDAAAIIDRGDAERRSLRDEDPVSANAEVGAQPC